MKSYTINDTAGGKTTVVRGSRVRVGTPLFRGRREGEKAGKSKKHTRAFFRDLKKSKRAGLGASQGTVVCFHKTEIGFSHLRECKVCQDYSDARIEKGRYIVTACDGHGGKIYLRSDRGSKFASEAAMQALLKAEPKADGTLGEEQCNRLRLEILCNWNARVEKDLADHPLTMEEVGFLSEENRFRLQGDPALAYGSTMHAVMLCGNAVVYAGIGDGGSFLLRDGKMISLEEDDESVANVTQSLCQEDAYEHLHVGVVSGVGDAGIVVCTDGTINPYRDLTNFRQAFADPLFAKLSQGKTQEVEEFMVSLGRKVGIGDDVSVGAILREGTKGKTKKRSKRRGKRV